MEEEQAGNQKTRDFICACGKNYLSYAALFTHIKQKHDGKAPGPIVRPRSQRKRGRPRKNPLNDQDLRNSDSDGAKNGISYVNEINNNINIFQKKAKQAAQILGCGQFQAFQAYRPQVNSTRKVKNDKQIKQLLKQTAFKRCSSNIQKGFQKLVKEHSSSQHEVPAQLKSCKSAPVENNEFNNDLSQYKYNFVIKNLKSLFENYEPTQQEYRCSQIIQIFDWLSQQINETSKLKMTNLNCAKLSIQTGFQNFLLQIQEHLEEFQWKQVSFFLSLFYQYIARQIGKPSNTMFLGLQVSQFTKYVTNFLYSYLQTKVKQLSVGQLHIFSENIPSNIIMCLYNWVALREMSENRLRFKNQQSKNQQQKMIYQELNKNFLKLNPTLTNEEKQIEAFNNSKEKSSCSQDLKFQQINDILQKLRPTRQNNLRQNINQQVNQLTLTDKIKTKKNSQENSQSVSQQNYQQNQESQQESIQGSSQCLNQKNVHDTDKPILSNR